MKANSKETKKALQELIMRGKEQGYLTYSEINDMLPEDLVTEEQIEPIVSVLEELDITITDEIPDADTLMVESGAKEVVAYATHAVLSGNAVKNIEKSGLTELVTTNTIPLSEDAVSCSKIRQLSIATTLAEVIKRISEEVSVSTIFKEN